MTEQEKDSVMKISKTEHITGKPPIDEPAMLQPQPEETTGQTFPMGAQSLEETMTELNMPKSFLKAG